MKNKISLFLAVAFAVIAAPLGAAEAFHLRGYGIADPTRYATPILLQSASQRAAELDLRRLFLYFNGCRIRKTDGGYAMTDTGHFKETTEINYKSLSPVLTEASFAVDLPPELAQRTILTIPFEISYSGDLQTRNFASVQKYLSFMDDILIKTLGDYLTKKGLFRGGEYLELDFLHFERSWGKKKVQGKIHFVIHR